MGLVRVGEGRNGHDTEQAKGSRKPRGWETTKKICFWHQVKLYIHESHCFMRDLKLIKELK